MIRKEKVEEPALGVTVFHEEIYGGMERMKIVGIRETEVELEGDYSGGTHAVNQKSWLPVKGLIRYKKMCEQHEKFTTCQLPNVHCQYPQCEPYIEDINEIRTFFKQPIP